MDSFELERAIKNVAEESTKNLKDQQELYTNLLGIPGIKLNFEQRKIF